MEEIREVLPARGRPSRRLIVENTRISELAARLYGLLRAAPSTRGASNELLAELLGCTSTSTVRDKLAELESAGLIDRHYDKQGRRLEVLDSSSGKRELDYVTEG